MTDAMEAPPVEASAVTARDSLERALRSRMSTRAFLPRSVAPQTIEAVLQAAGSIAGDASRRAGTVHVLMGESLLALCDEVCAEHDAGWQGLPGRGPRPERYAYYPERWFSPYIERRRENGWGLYSLLGIGKGDKQRMHAQHQRNYRFFEAPVGLVFTAPGDAGWQGMLHFGGYLQNAMVAAQMLGLDSCPQAAWNGFAHIVLSHVEADAGDTLMCCLALGYADPSAVVNTYITPRLPVADYARWME